MKEEQFKVLKTMSEATSRMDLNMLAKKVNLNPNQTIQRMQELAKEGFLQKVGGGFGITVRGKAAIKVFSPVPEEIGFHFYNGMNQPTDLTARTLEEFYRIIKKINVDSLEFHLYRDDFKNWIKEACKDPELADNLGRIKLSELKGEDLRATLLKALDTKYDIQEFL